MRQRSRRKNVGCDHRTHHLLRQPCGGSRRLRKHGNAGQQADCGFLPQSPRGKVEGVDVDGDSIERHANVQALEVLVARQTHGGSDAQQMCVAQLAADFREVLQRADGAIDVDHGIGFGVAGIPACDLEPLVATSGQGVGNLAQQLRPLRVTQFAQLGTSHIAGVPQCGTQIQAFRTGPRDDVPRCGIHQRRALSRARLPFAAEVAFEHLGA